MLSREEYIEKIEAEVQAKEAELVACHSTYGAEIEDRDTVILGLRVLLVRARYALLHPGYHDANELAAVIENALEETEPDEDTD